MEDEADAVLSDVEGDEQPVSISVDGEISSKAYKDLIAELEKERASREAAEAAKQELSASFQKLKALAHEAIKKRDEASRDRDEAVRKRDEALNYAKEKSARAGTEILDLKSQLDETVKERDELRSEMEKSRHMLTTGIEKISGKVGNFKSFSSLPRSQKYTGLPATAYGVMKRTNEIVEEMIKQVEVALKSRNEIREQMDLRNYEIAIEVSQLEASISSLREEVAKKEKEVEEKGRLMENEGEKMKEAITEYETKMSASNSKMESQMALMADHLSLVGKTHNKIYEIINILDANTSNSELSESLFLPRGTDLEESIRASLAGMESIHELTKVVSEKTRNIMELKNGEITDLNETLRKLSSEKEDLTSFLRSFVNDADNESEIYALASVLVNKAKCSQVEAIELRSSLERMRTEAMVLKEQSESQGKELAKRMRRIQELEEKEREANESIEGLMMDIATAEEEIERWKAAAKEEALAGGAVERESAEMVTHLRKEVEELRRAVAEAEKKLRYKEETSAAAMAAREAAERSLALADARASGLRERVEELSRQVEVAEMAARGRARYACWPWQWLGLDIVGTRHSLSNEMELSEPLV